MTGQATENSAEKAQRLTALAAQHGDCSDDWCAVDGYRTCHIPWLLGLVARLEAEKADAYQKGRDEGLNQSAEIAERTGLPGTAMSIRRHIRPAARGSVVEGRAHTFAPGIAEDNPTPDSRWCNVCGELREKCSGVVEGGDT